MTRLTSDIDKYDSGDGPLLVTAVHNGIKDLIRRKVSQSGASWQDFVTGRIEVISADDLAHVDQAILATGHRYAVSAVISATERPEAYQPLAGMTDRDRFSFEHAGARVESQVSGGRQLRGQGDNVVQHAKNLVGIARYFRTPQDVLECLTDGVPADTIAIIDDSGGTLTAPILEQFAGVICAGGTVRSHLGILTREYGIPCFMNAKINGIFNGDCVEMEISRTAKTLEDYQAGRDASASVWKVGL